MKKISILFFMWFSAIICSAQIQVSQNGCVGVGDTISNTNKLFVNTIGAYDAGLYSYIKSSQSWGYALLAQADFLCDRQIAIRGYASNPTPAASGRSYGVMGVAGNRTSGYNYGLYGELQGSNCGAGVFGTVSLQAPQINGRYAGYFDGDTYVSGVITVGEVSVLSDARYKSNIQQINASALTKIASLNPVQYTMASGRAIALSNTDESDTISSTTTTMSLSNEELTRANRIHYGLLAQEVKELYPELVQEDAAGVMSVNYTELIPLLIQAVQDLSDQVSSLSNSSNPSTRKQASKKQDNDTEILAALLYQNSPNPFTERTEISYVVPVEAQLATIYIFALVSTSF